MTPRALVPQRNHPGVLPSPSPALLTVPWNRLPMTHGGLPLACGDAGAALCVRGVVGGRWGSCVRGHGGVAAGWRPWCVSAGVCRGGGGPRPEPVCRGVVMVRGGRWGASVWPAVASAVLYGAYSYVLCLKSHSSGANRCWWELKNLKRELPYHFYRYHTTLKKNRKSGNYQ